jgi:hypothetical protein
LRACHCLIAYSEDHLKPTRSRSQFRLSLGLGLDGFRLDGPRI